MLVRLLALSAFMLALGALTAVVVSARADGMPAAAPAETTETIATTDGTPTAPLPPAAAPAAPRPTIAWRDRSRGVGVKYPSGWSFRADDERICFTLESAGVAIRVSERFGAGRRNVDRPRVEAMDWTNGGLGLLQRYGRSLAVDVVLGPGLPPADAAAAAAAVHSIVLARSGRCRPAASTQVEWRRSRPVGLPYAGRLRAGVRLPAEGRHYFTWDPVQRRSPDRPDRRWGTDGVVRITLAIVNAFAVAHPEAPRVGIGDVSRPRGGDFGPKHSSHQNGLDVDVYYPRRDGRERPPRRVSQVDRRLAQDLVNRFVAAGATRVFVGPNVRLTGPPRVVQRLWNHDNHLHARFPASRA